MPQAIRAKPGHGLAALKFRSVLMNQRFRSTVFPMIFTIFAIPETGNRVL